MRFRAARPEDAPAIEAFLACHPDTSMFLRSNLRLHGPCGGPEPHATTMWLQERAGRIAGVLGHTTDGVVLMQLPSGARAADLRQRLADSEIRGIFGATDQAHLLREALGMVAAPTQLDDDEPLYRLRLDRLVVPEGEGHLRAATAADRDLLIHWREDYLVETIHFEPEQAIEIAPQHIDGMLERQSLKLLETDAGAPLAMTSFNAILPDTVQIGNVYTPTELRGRGHARRAVALHLAEARDDGVARAILFASGPAASRAYEAIGFERIGSFTLLFFARPQVIGEPA